MKKIMNQKGQLTAEFIIILIVLLGLLMFCVGVFSGQMNQFVFMREQLESSRIANSVANVINQVYRDGNGASAPLYIPNSFDFNVTVSQHAVVVTNQTGFVEAPIVTGSVSSVVMNPGTNWRVNHVDQNVVFVQSS